MKAETILKLSELTLLPSVSLLEEAWNPTSLQPSTPCQSKLLRSLLPLLGQIDNSSRNCTKYNIKCLYKEKSRKKESYIPYWRKTGFECRCPAANAVKSSTWALFFHTDDTSGFSKVIAHSKQALKK